MLTDPAASATGNVFDGMIGGVQAGYNYRLRSGMLLGVEADFSFPNYLTSNSVVSSLTTAQSAVAEQWDYVGNRARPRRLCRRVLADLCDRRPGLGGRALPQHARDRQRRKETEHRLGWTAGAGVEYAFAPHWSARLEYLYSQFGKADIGFPSGTRYASTLDFQSLRVGLNRKIDWPASPGYDPKTSLTDPESDRWEIHGQTDVPAAGLSRIPRALYRPEQPDAGAAAAETWSNSLYLNARLWEGGEVYYNPELLQGFGLNDTVGPRAFPTAKRKSPTSPTRITTRRGCSSARLSASAASRKNSPSGPTQLAGKVDVSRLTLRPANSRSIDIFDGNAYAKDTRKDFMNWSMWAPGAFDYSADKVGLTYGATAELNQKQWALRAGYFLMQSVSNANNFDTNVFQRGNLCALNWKPAIRCSRSPANCGPSHGSTAPIPEATAKRWTIRRSISTSRRPARAASNMATSSTSNRH